MEEVCGVPQQLPADLGRPAQFVAVTAGGYLNETGVHSGEALELAAGSGAFNRADVLAGPGIPSGRQVLGEQRRECHRWQGDPGADATGHGGQAGDQAEERGRDGCEAQRAGDLGDGADAVGGAAG